MGKQINETWRQWFSRKIYGTKWTTVAEQFKCEECKGWSLSERRVSPNNPTATNTELLYFAETRRRCPYCKSELVMWVRD